MPTPGDVVSDVLVVSFYILGITFCTGTSFPERRLVDDLLRNYNTTPRPVGDPGEVLDVRILLKLGRIEQLSEKDQTLQSFGWLITKWRDVQLQWNASQYNGAQRIVLDGRYVWLPEIVLFNGLDNSGEFKDFATSRVLVLSDGQVLWVPGISFRTSCDLDLTYFPYDIQKVCWVFVNWMYNASTQNVSYVAPTMAMDSYQRNGEWQALKTEVRRFDYSTEAERQVFYPVVQFCLYIQRRPEFYSRTIILPCMTITLVSALIFILPPESGEKVSFGISVMVSFTIFLLMISDVVPRSSVKMPFISTYMLINIIQMGLSLGVTVVILNVYHHTPEKPVPALCKRFAGRLARILCIRHRLTPKRGRSSNEARVSAQSEKDSDVRMRELAISPVPSSFKESFGNCNGNVRRDTPERSASLRDVGDTLNTERNRDDWRFLARVLDRLMLIIYLLAVIFTTGSFCVIVIFYDKERFMRMLSEQNMLDPMNDRQLAFT